MSEVIPISVSSKWRGSVESYAQSLESMAHEQAILRYYDRREVVGLGIRRNHGTIHWMALENVAEEEPWRTFEVTPMNANETLEFLGANFGLPDEVFLWHSHFMLDGPTRSDIDMLGNFPIITWGLVYNVPSRRTYWYNSKGQVI